jgi:hypothetical protein
MMRFVAAVKRRKARNRNGCDTEHGDYVPQETAEKVAAVLGRNRYVQGETEWPTCRNGLSRNKT